jgi:hypothetical protein
MFIWVRERGDPKPKIYFILCYTEENQMNDKPIFSLAIKERLVKQGFEVKRETPNYSNPGKRVFYFEATPDLLEAFDKILKGE